MNSMTNVPFLSISLGASDIETLKNVKSCDWEFDSEAFKNVSEEGKDFIRKLLIKIKEKRLTAHECLQHAWLTGDHSHKTLEIARQRFFAIRFESPLFFCTNFNRA